MPQSRPKRQIAADAAFAAGPHANCVPCCLIGQENADAVRYNQGMTLFSAACFLRVSAAAAILVRLSFSDIRSGRIPDRAVLILSGLALLRLISAEAVSRPAVFSLGLLAGGTGIWLLLLGLTWLLDRFFGRETLGGGDIKLCAALGFHLGFSGAMYMLLAACGLALIFSLILRRPGRSHFPFAPYLSAAGLVMLLLQA